MHTEVDLDILTHYSCLEPEIGEQIVFLYPEFLSESEKAAFELHQEGCESCRERRKLWQATGLSFRLEALLKRVERFFADNRTENAIGLYLPILTLQADLRNHPEDVKSFQDGAWLSLTAARSKDRDIMPYLAPSYAPGASELAAATQRDIFPLNVEYAEGEVKGEIRLKGKQVFFELTKTSEQFRDGIILVGKILKPVPMLKSWQIVPKKRQRLGTSDDLFESIELRQVSDSLKMFQVLAL